MPCIVRDGTYRVYVYANDHNPPHCHVFWDGYKVAVVNLLPVSHSQGDRLPRRGVELVRANVDELLAAWQELNP